MQKVMNFFVAMSLIFIFSCNNQTKEQATDQPINEQSRQEATTKTAKAKLEIVYFHATNRCITCNSVENNAKKLLDENYKTQVEKGEITFVSLNIDDEQNKAITEKYQVSFSTLLLINNKTEQEGVTNFTETAFKYAKNSPEKYIELLKEEINKIIN